jgi:schlafen family protein
MANSDGGVIIYGIKEHQTRKHLPEKIDPIDRSLFSKEWLEQVINTIRPRIDRLIVHPVPLNSGASDVVYVAEIPQSTTAHQARDYRYYKRLNFESVPMEDYEVRDVMNRATTPHLAVEFGYHPIAKQATYHHYILDIVVSNLGDQVVSNFQLEFSFPDAISVIQRTVAGKEHIELVASEDGDAMVVYRSKGVLFPEQALDIGGELRWTYEIDRDSYEKIQQAGRAGWDLALNWTLYADNMKPRRGRKPLSELQAF